MSDLHSSLYPRKMGRRSFLSLSGAALTTALTLSPSPASTAVAIQVRRSTVAGVPLYQTSINLRDPHMFLALGLANNSSLGNFEGLNGYEPFSAMVSRYHAAIVANGTFFNLYADRVMGNLVSAGRFLTFSPYENYGTTLGLRAGNRPEMVTARVDGRPTWEEHWFSITAGPRLLRNGQIWLAPRTEGFRDPRVMGVAPRSAIGFPASGNQLILVTFLTNLSLQQEARVMRSIGCSEAMNLDGGSSLGLSWGGRILQNPGRSLANVIVAYDNHYPAPQFLRESWHRFQAGDRPHPGQLYSSN